jgi:CMP-2-keto-3-deoxyoctulosonic acid synthetase
VNTIGIVPARYASTRFPGKPLALIAKQVAASAASRWPTKPCKPGIGVELDWDAIDRAWVEHKITKVS